MDEPTDRGRGRRTGRARRTFLGRQLARLNVRGRLLALIGTVALGWVVTLGVVVAGVLAGNHGIASASGNFNQYATERAAYEGWLTDDDQSNMSAALASLREASQRGLLDTTMGQVEQGHAQAVSALAQLARHASTAALRADATRTARDVAAYNVFTDEVLSDIRAGRLRDAVTAVSITNASISNQTQADFDSFGSAIAGRVSTIRSSLDDTNYLVLIVHFLVAALAALLCWRITRHVMKSITRPLQEVSSALEGVAAGDLSRRARVRQANDEFSHVADLLNAAIAVQEETTTRERASADDLRGKVDQILSVVNAAAEGDLTSAVPVDGEDAIGQVGSSLATFLDDLRGRIATIGRNASSLAASSGQLTDTAERMSSAAHETSAQASAVSDTSRAVSEHVSDVASAAQELSASIQEIATNSAEATRVAAEAVEAAEAASVTVSQLGRSSTEISEVTKVISSIAQQTNLLALNATIEAARAGEAGDGFAVVANEVKELAEETANATNGINEKIDLIQRDTGSAVDAINRISEIIATINERQQAIADAVAQQTDTTNEIARTVGGAAEGASGISATMGGVAEAAAEASGGATETEAAAEALARTASELQELVARFAV